MEITYDWAARPAYDVLSDADRAAIDAALRDFATSGDARVKRIGAGGQGDTYIVNPGRQLRLLVRWNEQAGRATVADIMKVDAVRSYS